MKNLANLSIGHEVPISKQASTPGKQDGVMPGKDPVNDQLPSDDGKSMLPYLAAGKLKGKKALITGGDSGIGRAVAILFAMEGADVTITYMGQESKDAEETKRLVEEKGGKCYTISADLRNQQACKNVVQKSIEHMGRISTLVLNHGTQRMRETIADLSEYVLDMKHTLLANNLTGKNGSIHSMSISTPFSVYYSYLTRNLYG